MKLTSKIHFQIVSRLKNTDFILDPEHRLTALDMERLYSMSWQKFLPLSLGTVAKLCPSAVKLILASDNVVRIRVFDVQ